MLTEINEKSGIPLVGVIQFGIIDRGTSLLQIRTTTVCNMNCPFCSTDAGPFSKFHKNNFIVEPDYMIKWIKEIINLKNSDIHCNIDSVGEPTTYKELPYLIKEMSKIKEVKFISMQTNGTFLTEELINDLEKAGLNRIHISIHSLDSALSKKLFGSENYSINDIRNSLKLLSKSKIEVLLAPVYLPGINDSDILEIIKLAKEFNFRLGIQKYEEYKYSRKMKNVKKTNYYRFYNKLKEWEKEFNIKLTLNPKDLQVEKAKSLPKVFDINEKIFADIKCPGWFPNQMIAVAKNRSITVNDCSKNINDKVKIKITENKNNIYMAELI